MLLVVRSDSSGSLGCGCRTTPSHVARYARELSGGARRTRNRWWCSTRPCAGHRVEFQGFADVPRALGSRPAATLSPPRARRKTSDASGGEGGWFRQGGCCPLWPPNLGFLCDSRSDGRHRVPFSFRALQSKGVVLPCRKPRFQFDAARDRSDDNVDFELRTRIRHAETSRRSCVTMRFSTGQDNTLFEWTEKGSSRDTGGGRQ